ncbi:MAG: hypothetical protein ACYDC2_10700 [Solirubrobacteraceae bacterium]
MGATWVCRACFETLTKVVGKEEETCLGYLGPMECVLCGRRDEHPRQPRLSLRRLWELLLMSRSEVNAIMAYVDDAKLEACKRGRVTGEPLADWIRRLPL